MCESAEAGQSQVCNLSFWHTVDVFLLPNPGQRFVPEASPPSQALPGGGWVQTHLEWPEEKVEFSGFNVHREAADEQCPDLGTETTVVRASLTEDKDDGFSFGKELEYS